jgi:[protein-PII] uridylyltransferase
MIAEALKSGGDAPALVDGAALRAAMTAIAEADLPRREARQRIIALLKGVHEEGSAAVRRRLEGGESGMQAARANGLFVDQMVRALYDHVVGHLYPTANPSTGEALALVAVGGYGRGELAPYSDLDLLFLVPYKVLPRSEQVVEEVLYFLWDLGFKVGHAVRSVDDCVRLAKADHVICTSLLEARWVAGDKALYEEMRRRFRRDVQRGRRAAAAFIKAKLAEREQRHKRLGDSRYSLEPNIKEGKGGLRDLHSLFWIAKFLYDVDDIGHLIKEGVFTREEVARFRKAESHLWTLRFYLHYLAARAEERLTFDFQVAIAPRLGYTTHAGSRDVERFMKHYFLVAKDVGALTRIFCAFLEVQHGRRRGLRFPRRRVAGFVVESDRLAVKSPDHFAAAPIDLIRLFRVAQERGLEVHPQTMRWITRHLRLIGKALREDRTAGALFLEILTADQDPATVLRLMNETGVLGKFMPDFGRVVAQMQYNMYHHFTVDEHTIFCIGVLHEIEQGGLKYEAPIASEVVHKVVSRRVLYLAVLFHDIAKGRRGDHSEVGAKIAGKACTRLGLTEAETETVAWLVRHHLAMSNTAFKRDLGDPKTIQDFARLVQSPERLRLLLVLTVADIRAVGPNVWSAWKAVLLRELYWRTEELLSGGVAKEERKARVENVKEALAGRLADWPKKDVTAHLRRGVDDYWLSNDLDTLVRQAELVRRAEDAGETLAIDFRLDSYRQASEVIIYAQDHQGLFARLAGAMAVAGASIDGARIATLKNGMALDSFFIEDASGGPFDEPRKLVRLRDAIRRSVAGKLKPLQELAARGQCYPSRYRVFKVQPRVLIDNAASRDHTVIEVNGRDRPGLLYEVTLALSKMRLAIRQARITTFGEHVVDVFYVQDQSRKKIESKRRHATIERNLLIALRDDSTDEAPPERKGPPRPGRESARGPQRLRGSRG